jgi:hemerythrin-like metal-binding protein
MSAPLFPLGVQLMDDDHAHLEELFACAGSVEDDKLADFLETVRAEVAAHFAREEEHMQARDVPVYDCHVAQHRLLLAELDAVRAQAENMAPSALRSFLDRVVPNLVMSHVASVDRVTATFLQGGLDARLVGKLRLPTPTLM